VVNRTAAVVVVVNRTVVEAALAAVAISRNTDRDLDVN